MGLGVLAQDSNPSTLGTEARRPQFLGHPWLHSNTVSK